MSIPLNIDWQQILLHLFNFAILAGGLYFLLYKPVKSFMVQREEHYAAMDAAAAEKQKNAEELEAQRQRQLDGLHEELDAMKAQAAKDAEKLAALTVSDAEAQREQILAKAREDASHEKEKILQDAREEIVQLAVAAAAKMTREEKAKHG